MKKPIAVKINNKEEYDLAIEALDLAGFRWGVRGDRLKEYKYTGTEFDYILIDPEEGGFIIIDNRVIPTCVFSPGPFHCIRNPTQDIYDEMLLDDFVKLFSSMTEQDAIDFCNSYFTEEGDPDEVGEEAGGGVKHDSGKIRITTLFERPFAEQIEQVVQVLEMGAEKYSDHNWQKVAEGESGEQRYADAFRRHWQAILKGEVKDSESGLSHYAHAIANLFFLFWKEEHND